MTTLLAKSQFRFALRHPVGALASLLGVTVAVTALVAVHLLGQSLRSGLEAAASATLGGYTHVLTSADLEETDYFRLRERWRGGEPALANVQALAPVVDDYVVVGGESESRKVLRSIGVDPLAAGQGLSDVPALSGGSGASAAGRFLIDDVVLADTQTAKAIVAAGNQINGLSVTVVEAPAVATLLADLPTAQRLLDREGELDAVWIRVASPRSQLLTWLDALLPGVAAALPSYATPTIEGFHVAAERRWNPLQRFADASIFNLGMLALLSVLMATFLTAQASFANAARRRQERQRLLALGVSSTRLRLLAASEGLLVGSVGAGLGIVLGNGVALLALEATGNVDDLAIPTPALDGWAVGKAFFCGGAVATVGALFADREPRTHPRTHIVSAIVVLALTIVGLAGGASGSLPRVFAALLAAVGVQILVIVPFAGFVARKATTRYGFGSLVTRSSLRDAAGRIGEIRLALGALSVASAVAIGMGLMVESLRRDFTSMLDQRLWNGVHVSATAAEPKFDIEWIRGLPGSRDVRRYGEFDARLPQGLVRVDVAVLDSEETARYGFAGALTQDVMLNEVGARLFDLGVGDVVVLSAGGASEEVKVAHVFRDFGAVQPRLLTPMSRHAPFADLVAWRQIWVRTEAGDAARLSAALANRYGNARITDQAQIRSAAMAIFDRSFAISRTLTVVALVVAAIGLYAALTALLASRQREFRLWTALGLSGGEIWRQAMAQTFCLGLLAVASAVPFGLFVAWVLCDFVNPLAFGWSIDLHPHTGAIGYPLLLGLAVALLAGATPAYRLARRTAHGL